MSYTTNAFALSSWVSGSICDNLGNLLFYTDGHTVAGSSNTLIPNGTFISGTRPYNSQSYTLAQSSLIIKKPGSSGNRGIYYIFTSDNDQIFSAPPGPGSAPIFHELNFSEVDLSLAAGQGSVVSKNNLINSNTCEKIAAVKHCNGKDVWLITHEANSDRFLNYLITANGLNSTPVISSLGPLTSTVNGAFCLKVSPNGKKIGMWNTVFDFDNASGQVSNPVTLTVNNGFLGFPWGCEFSPDGKKYYVSDDWQQIYQWDLCPALPPPGVLIGTDTSQMFTTLSDLQLAANGKIYVTRTWKHNLGEIQSPNTGGTGCNYTGFGQPLGMGVSNFYLPAFMSSYFYSPEPPPPPFTYSANCISYANTSGATSFTLPVICTASEHYTQNLAWYFGDPASGSANTSTLSNPTHVYQSPGTYSVQLFLFRNCKTDTINQAVTVSVCANLGLTSQNLESSFHVYPNPNSSEQMTLENSEDLEVVICNELGLIVFESTLRAGKHTIDINRLSSGVYTVKAKNKNSSATRKILVTKH